MKRYQPFVGALTALLIAALTPSGATAQTSVETGGIVSGSQKILSEIELPDGRVIRRIYLSASVTADDNTHPWHLGSQDCLATYMFAADGSLIGGRGSCDLVSPDGDMWWLTLEASGTDPIRWQGLEGTGKFAGVEHSGMTVLLAEWEDGKFISRWDGTMTTP
jgi:hypothetical protein